MERTAVERHTRRDDKFHDECGVFGVWTTPRPPTSPTSASTRSSTAARSRPASSPPTATHFHVEKAMGSSPTSSAPSACGACPAIAPSATCATRRRARSNLRNAQPIAVDYARGPIAVAHNGNLVNAEALREELEADGAIFQSTSDTEVILHLHRAGRRRRRSSEQIADALAQVEGAYSLLLLTPDAHLSRVRDPYGFRPLMLGQPGRRLGASRRETCALDLIDAELVREVEPGEMVVIDDAGLRSRPRRFRPASGCSASSSTSTSRGPTRSCAAATSTRVRKALGRQLAREHPAEADVVIPVPDSASAPRSATPRSRASPSSWASSATTTSAAPSSSPAGDPPLRREGEAQPRARGARGQAGGGGRRLDRARHHQPQDRQDAPRAPARARCTCASPRRRPSGPATTASTRRPASELIASSHSVEEIRRYLGADSLGYLSLDGMLKATGSEPAHFCHACFTGALPRRHRARADLPQLRLFDS